MDLLLAEALVDFAKLTPAANGEYQATDAINAYARNHDVLIHPTPGRYYDCGNSAGLLAATNAAAHPSRGGRHRGRSGAVRGLGPLAE